METEILHHSEAIIANIPAWSMIGFGVLLFGLELMLGSFVLLFFGFSFIIIGTLSFDIHLSGELQILFSVILGAMLTFLLRKPFIASMMADKLKEEVMVAGDTGKMVENNGALRVEYKGTTWPYTYTGNTPLRDGDTVMVTALKNNSVTIKLA